MSPSPQDPHTGGSLTDMAPTGTSIPNDAGTYPTLPSVPSPSTTTEDTSTSLASAATNPSDIPRSTKDIGATGEVQTGTGDTLPATAETKNLRFGGSEDVSKGHQRYDKHVRQKESDFEKFAGGAEGVGGDEKVEG